MGHKLDVYFVYTTNKIGYESTNSDTDTYMPTGKIASIIGTSRSQDCLGLLGLTNTNKVASQAISHSTIAIIPSIVSGMAPDTSA